MYIMIWAHVLRLDFTCNSPVSNALVTYSLSALIVSEPMYASCLGAFAKKGVFWLLTHLCRLTIICECEPVHDLSGTFLCVCFFNLLIFTSGTFPLRAKKKKKNILLFF